jgi:hypothetical protein
VPNAEGATCATCRTLNPAGAPACIRCNTPLGAPPPAAAPPRPPAAPPLLPPASAAPPATAPDSRIGPGLAAPPRGTPGGSARAAAHVQPPGYGEVPAAGAGAGTGAGAAPPGGREFTPHEQRRIRRRIALAGGAAVALVLAGGGAALWLTRPHYVDTDAVAARLGADLSARLGERVTVECHGTPRRRAGETFGCAATDASGVRLTVAVTIVDDTGRYRWRLGR